MSGREPQGVGGAVPVCSDGQVSCFAAVFAINEAHRFDGLHRLIRGIADGGASKQWLALGRFDHLLLTLGNDADDLTGVEQEIQGQPGASGSWSFYGRCLLPKSFDWDRAYAENAVAGFCTIRTNLTVTGLVGDTGIAGLERAVSEALTGLDLEWTIGSTTGWDDFVIFFFSKGVNVISHAVGKLRGMHTASISEVSEGRHRHWMLTSCTIPLLRFPWSERCLGSTEEANSARNELVDDVLGNADANESLSWAVRFELRPGHWDGFLKEFQERAVAAGVEVVVTKVFGQVDLRAGAPEGTLGSLISFLAEVAFPLVCEEDTVIRSMETHLHLDAAAYVEDADSSAFAPSIRPVDQIGLSAGLDDALLATAQKWGVPRHTLDTITQTFRKIEAFESHDLLSGEFRTMERVAQHFIMGLEGLEEPNNSRVRQLQDPITDWLFYVERALSDRYRGLYPTGENMIMRLGSYHGSHQKFLSVADHLSTSVFESARQSVVRRHEELGLPVVDPESGRPLIPDVCVATFLGNSPTPWSLNCIPFFKTAFIDLPVSLVFHPRHCVTLFHELGHILWDAYRTWNTLQRFDLESLLELEKTVKGAGDVKVTELTNPDKQYPDVPREVKEVLADLFSCCLLAKGDVSIHSRNTEEVIRYIYPLGPEDRPGRSFLMDHQLRLVAVGQIVSLFEKGDDLSDFQKYNGMMESFRDHGDTSKIIAQADEISVLSGQRMQKRRERLERALAVMDILVQVDSFRAFLAGIVDLAAEQFLDPKTAEIVTPLRDLMEEESSGLFSDLAFLDDMWELSKRREAQR